MNLFLEKGDLGIVSFLFGTWESVEPLNVRIGCALWTSCFLNSLISTNSRSYINVSISHLVDWGDKLPIFLFPASTSILLLFPSFLWSAHRRLCVLAIGGQRWGGSPRTLWVTLLIWEEWTARRQGEVVQQSSYRFGSEALLLATSSPTRIDIAHLVHMSSTGMEQAA